jgi:spore coat protein CotF
VPKHRSKRKEIKMTLSQKENSLLCDLKSQEQLCIEKYGKYEADANDPCLKTLFKNIKSTEESHLSTISRIMSGEEVSTSTPPTAVSGKLECAMSSCNEQQKQSDAFLCKDALAMEKHVSSLYDTSIFEFTSPTLRDTLNHIQKEEQIHGEQLYEYMSKNNMYS